MFPTRRYNIIIWYLRNLFVILSICQYNSPVSCWTFLCSTCTIITDRGDIPRGPPVQQVPIFIGFFTYNFPRCSQYKAARILESLLWILKSWKISVLVGFYKMLFCNPPNINTQLKLYRVIVPLVSVKENFVPFSETHFVSVFIYKFTHELCVRRTDLVFTSKTRIFLFRLFKESWMLLVLQI